jgi:flagellar L-ring protein precursor FlgH
MRHQSKISVMALGAALLGGCAGLSNAIASPELTPISNPATVAGAGRVSMPLPAPTGEISAPNSLWRSGARSFFGDQRASAIGDILTVNIEIADSAHGGGYVKLDRDAIGRSRHGDFSSVLWSNSKR